MDAGALGQVELATLLAETSLSVAACDASGHMTFLSPALEALFGRKFEGLHESQYVESFDLYDAADERRLRTEDVPIARALRGEVVKDALITAHLARGPVFLRCNAAPIRDAAGDIDGAVVLVQDVTAEHTAHREQAELRARLVETVNHEFRTPLTKLLGHTELLHELDREHLPAAVRRSLEVVGHSANELADLMETVSELLDLEAHTKLSKTVTDVVDLVRGIADEFGPSGRGVRLVLDSPETLPAAVDRQRIRRAVVELLDNAATYSPPDADIRLRLTEDGATVSITICDSGSGIAPEERERHMQPFERGRHPQQPVSGRGLGLAIARTVAAAHGGRLTLAEHAPRGLCAALLLPRGAPFIPDVSESSRA